MSSSFPSFLNVCVQHTAQSLLSLPDCEQLLLDSNVSFAVKTHIVSFLVEVYVIVESQGPHHRHHHPFARILAEFARLADAWSQSKAVVEDADELAYLTEIVVFLPRFVKHNFTALELLPHFQHLATSTMMVVDLEPPQSRRASAILEFLRALVKQADSKEMDRILHRSHAKRSGSFSSMKTRNRSATAPPSSPSLSRHGLSATSHLSAHSLSDALHVESDSVLVVDLSWVEIIRKFLSRWEKETSSVNLPRDVHVAASLTTSASDAAWAMRKSPISDLLAQVRELLKPSANTATFVDFLAAELVKPQVSGR
jgi:hypothetical protein